MIFSDSNRRRLGNAAIVQRFPKGAFNYVDGKYIENFEFDQTTLKPGETFVISREEMTELYEKDEAFREMMGQHKHIYVDGHICENSPTYVHSGDKEPHMTIFALGHVDQCCMKFKKLYFYKGYSNYRVGELHSCNEYNKDYFAIHGQEVDDVDMDDLLKSNMEYLSQFARTPREAILQLMKDQGLSQQALARTTGFSQSKISKMLADEDYNYSIQDVTRLVIGFRMPPPLSGLFLELVGFSRTAMIRQYKYQCIIDCMFMDDIYEVTKAHPKLFDK